MNAIHIIVSGKVQGVFYRKNTQQKAQELGVSGTVQNLSDGTVEIYASGEEEDLKTLLWWTHSGSPSAEVNSVTSEFDKKENLPKPFEIKR